MCWCGVVWYGRAIKECFKHIIREIKIKLYVFKRNHFNRRIYPKYLSFVLPGRLSRQLLLTPTILVNDTNIAIRKVAIGKDPAYNQKDGSMSDSSPTALRGCSLEKIGIKK